MNTLRMVLVSIALALLVQVSSADDRSALVGTWKVLSFEMEYQDGRPASPWEGGRNPVGFLIFTEQGRMMSMIEGVDRKPAKTDEERGALLRTMIAYTGPYRLEGDKWITHVDASWVPSWTGTEQARFYKLDGDRLQVTTAWFKYAMLSGEPMARGVLTWGRVK
ncbi:MAG: lipocalin-like domain-containing protein [Rhodocyclaceae bacterium]|nr:lipocalin-like domain-containing protein [Rhodocyclaceae bacterium]